MSESSPSDALARLGPGEPLWSRSLRYGAWVVCTLPLLVAGQPRSSTLPAGPSNDAPPTVFAPGQQGPPPGPPQGVPSDPKHVRPFAATPGPRGQLRDEEWKEAEAFFKTHAPTYLAKAESLRLPEARMRQLRSAIIGRFETLQRLHEHFPELFEVREHQLELFDALFATHEQFTTASAGAEKDRLRAQMKTEIADLLANSLKDRETRINRLQEMLGKLQGSVEDDTHHQQELVEAHFKRVLDKGVDASLLDGLMKDDADTTPLEHPVRRPRPTTTP